jgi:2-polyprenyl-3-methyl-5-hydroxy-6-metoxy-1,4-benzoquinol methylase
MIDTSAPASVRSDHAKEVERGERFRFGANWARFIELLDDDRITTAESSLRRMLEVDRLDGMTFLDVGSGSGLFSLAARRLGARVHSFDFDPQSVACTRELRRRYFPDDAQWEVAEASVLDPDYMRGIGPVDIVYSWGVLHHTGAMWDALRNAQLPLRVGGRLFIAIYNDVGGWSRFYTGVKRLYVRAPAVGKAVIGSAYAVTQVVKGAAKDTMLLRNPLQRYREKRRVRGMSMLRDWIDWVGGYPFEVARPEQIVDFYRDLGFSLDRMLTCGGGQGCNEFVFRRIALPEAAAIGRRSVQTGER